MERYYVQQKYHYFVIYDSKNKILPLPFKYICEQYAKEACNRFNAFGIKAVLSEYNKCSVSGYGNTNLNYKEWIEKNNNMFKF